MTKILIRVVLPLLALTNFYFSDGFTAITLWAKANRSIELDIRPYVEAFYEMGKTRGLNLDLSRVTIRFEHPTQEGAPEGGTTIGKCFPLSFLSNEFEPLIIIDPSYWYSHSEWDREALIYHELGHCILQRFEHIDNLKIVKNKDGSKEVYPESLMDSTVVDGSIYQKYQAYYLDELFYEADPGVKLKYYWHQEEPYDFPWLWYN